MDIKFTKMHALGNDFVIIDLTNQDLQINDKIAQFICNRKIGIGCDQLLIIQQINQSPYEYKYRIFNSDGSEPEHCGNGARCVIKYIYTHKNCKLTNSVILHTKNRIITGSISDNTVTVNMGMPSFNPSDMPFNHKLNPNNVYELKLHNTFVQFGIVSVGNPHVIVKIISKENILDKKSLEKLATMIQNSGYFPNGVNVNFYLKLEENAIQLVTYERGCGFTESCGTGACATVAYGIAQNFLSGEVNVLMPNGEILINWNKKDQIRMTGEAKKVFDGSIVL